MTLNKSITVLFVALSLSFTGCFAQQLEEPTSREYETFTGEFKSLGGIRVNKMITHLFEEDDGDIYYTYSDRYNLDDSNYFNVRYEVYGVVMEYESLDKPVLQVKRIDEAPEEDTVEFDVESVSHKDVDLGFSIDYPNNWTIESLRDSVRLEAPLAELEGDDEESDSEEEQVADYIIIARSDETLETTADDDLEDRETDILNIAASTYPELSGQQGESSHIGPDRLFGLKYTTDGGNVHYFIPRGEELYEVSFYHPDPRELDRIKNTNTFGSIVSSLRFLPRDGEDFGSQDELDDSDENDSTEPEETDAEIDNEVEEPETTAEPVEKPETTPEPTASSDQVSFSSYTSFESRPFNFKGVYPAPWYYSGRTGGYDFGPDSFESDDAEVIIRLDLQTTGTEGTVNLGANVRVTVKVDGRYYVFTGPTDYQSTMQSMAAAIEGTSEDA